MIILSELLADVLDRQLSLSYESVFDTINRIDKSFWYFYNYIHIINKSIDYQSISRIHLFYLV